MALAYIIVGFLTLAAIIVGFLTIAAIWAIIAAVYASSSNGAKTLPPSVVSNRQPIDPTPFHTGYIQNLPPQQKIADACNNTIYPVQPPYVDYGTAFSTAVAKSESCDVNIFNSPP